MDNNQLRILKKFIRLEEGKVVEKTIEIRNFTLINLRESLIGLGTILYEDLDNNIYVLSVKAGFADKNNAVIMCQLNDDSLLLLGYAKEGLINQHTSEKAVDKVINCITEYKKRQER